MGNVLKKLLVLALALASLGLCGCQTGNVETATIGMNTDARGRHAHTYIIKSSGDKDIDRRARDSASIEFRRQVRTPLKNQRYVIEVDIHTMEPIWGGKAATN
jgi:hypothetical protein